MTSVGPTTAHATSQYRRHVVISGGFLVARLLHLVVGIYLVLWTLVLMLVPVIEAKVLNVHNPMFSAITLGTLDSAHDVAVAGLANRPLQWQSPHDWTREHCAQGPRRGSELQPNYTHFGRRKGGRCGRPARGR
ncbi:Aste57867_4364 [Aphanomyces stellatus]|uniref:Aste57867_4364 protein n=1 Tax=Aphanomyces stellatus TaxID=120398 RepID=A0A485KGQ2_9STRA|nr:hypothetical protein As57867_004352 [Aphanomyces stellatus]VFT81478.1 Aste57867_4364 [Aphanomyces stellatus]